MRRVAISELAAVISVTAAFACNAALAQAMTDPTRPPVELTEAASREAASSELVLQSVMITPTLKTAIINGEIVKLGGKFGNAQLMKISENEVVLKSGDQIQVLKMYPSVEKRDSTRGAPKAASGRAAGRKKPAAAGTGDAR